MTALTPERIAELRLALACRTADAAALNTRREERMAKKNVATAVGEARVIVTRPVVGAFHMQVCAVNDATDDEILSVCNAENPAGTTGGWGTVIRSTEPDEFWGDVAPKACAFDSRRSHYLVSC